MPLLSIVIPVFNEQATIRQLVSAVRSVSLPDGVDRELILVDDASADGCAEILAELASLPDVRVFRQPLNGGKGSALRRGFEEARGDFILVQDADLEYEPGDYPKLLRPLLDDQADVVYGSRFTGGDMRPVLFFRHYVGNRVLTLLSNIVTNLNLTDMETCYKVFRRSLLERIRLRENRFGFEPEFTAKIARLGVRFYEVSISYSGRTYGEGKKIGWRDGFRALWCIFKYGVLRL